MDKLIRKEINDTIELYFVQNGKAVLRSTGSNITEINDKFVETFEKEKTNIKNIMEDYNEKQYNDQVSI